MLFNLAIAFARVTLVVEQTVYYMFIMMIQFSCQAYLQINAGSA